MPGPFIVVAAAVATASGSVLYKYFSGLTFSISGLESSGVTTLVNFFNRSLESSNNSLLESVKNFFSSSTKEYKVDEKGNIKKSDYLLYLFDINKYKSNEQYAKLARQQIDFAYDWLDDNSKPKKMIAIGTHEDLLNKETTKSILNEMAKVFKKRNRIKLSFIAGSLKDAESMELLITFYFFF